MCLSLEEQIYVNYFPFCEVLHDISPWDLNSNLFIAKISHVQFAIYDTIAKKGSTKFAILNQPGNLGNSILIIGNRNLS